MVADEQIEQLAVKPFRTVLDLAQLQPRLDVEMVANVAGLQIEVEQADAPIPGLLVQLQLDRRLDGQGRVTDPTCARQEPDNDGFCPGGGRSGLRLARARDDLMDFLRRVL